MVVTSKEQQERCAICCCCCSFCYCCCCCCYYCCCCCCCWLKSCDDSRSQRREQDNENQPTKPLPQNINDHFTHKPLREVTSFWSWGKYSIAEFVALTHLFFLFAYLHMHYSWVMVNGWGSQTASFHPPSSFWVPICTFFLQSQRLVICQWLSLKGLEYLHQEYCGWYVL